MQMPDKAIIVARLKKKSNSMVAPEEDDKEGYDEDAKLQDIAEDMIKAIQSKDPEQLKELLKEAFDCLGDREV